jgi:hypothetical protein
MTIELDPSPDLRTHGDEVLGHLARTTRSHGIDPLAARMEALGAALAADVAEVDRTLGALAEARGDLAERAAGHLLAHPGKRIRASCALLAARLGPRPAPTAVREVAMAAELAGAALAEAQSSRQVAILEARAKKESAISLAEAEVIRAKGAAEANAILQNSLGGPEGYLRYLQIQALESSKANLIYVPTEGGLPVTEARRLGSDTPQPTPDR